ncbi:MAG: outer membrane protein assembly factor BamD [Alphaproteobacteria bacterium]|nr:outer membrane protein assembly factor BamD [Alphaproteobacteria bacterium]
MKYFHNILCAVCLNCLLCGCVSDQKEPENAEELYNQAYNQLQDTSYSKAAKSFEQVELEYPYSKWAIKAKLMGAYAYYKDYSYDDAIISLDRFIKFHPGNKDIAYAYYLKALCYYDQITSVEKDQSITAKAMEALNNVIIRFPDSDYAKDARAKLDLTIDHLAGQQMEIGRYYLKQQNYLSALNRFSEVVTRYQTTSHIEEALYRQTEIYTIMGLNDEAGKAAQVLIYNYPDSSWSKEAKKLVSKK